MRRGRPGRGGVWCGFGGARVEELHPSRELGGSRMGIDVVCGRDRAFQALDGCSSSLDGGNCRRESRLAMSAAGDSFFLRPVLVVVRTWLTWLDFALREAQSDGGPCLALSPMCVVEPSAPCGYCMAHALGPCCQRKKAGGAAANSSWSVAPALAPCTAPRHHPNKGSCLMTGMLRAHASTHETSSDTKPFVPDSG